MDVSDPAQPRALGGYGTLGEVYEYFPSRAEVMIVIGVAGVGVLIFTLLSKIAIPLAFHEPGGGNT